ncbi:MAG: protein-tyrosine kinase [Lachnospiraceae bacterium]|nr:protein-tyrosine kinase [Lachnospiraceae bacterium]
MEIMQSYQNERTEIDLMEVLRLLLHNAWIIGIAAVVLALGGLVFSKFFITPKYTSTTSIYVLNNNENTGVTYTDTQLSLQIMKDYKEIITSRSVLEETMRICHLDMTYKTIKDKVKLSNTDGTRVIQISVTDPDPEAAREIADTIRIVSTEKIKAIVNVDAVNTVDEANLPTAASSPSVMRWTLIGFLAGALLSILVLVILYLVDTTIKSTDEVEKYLGLSTLASIPVIASPEAAKKHKKKGVVQKLFKKA